MAAVWLPALNQSFLCYFYVCVTVMSLDECKFLTNKPQQVCKKPEKWQESLITMKMTVEMSVGTTSTWEQNVMLR
jgi:hypothetical protein